MMIDTLIFLDTGYSETDYYILSTSFLTGKGWCGWAKVFEERHYPSQGVLRELIKYLSSFGVKWILFKKIMNLN